MNDQQCGSSLNRLIAQYRTSLRRELTEEIRARLVTGIARVLPGAAPHAARPVKVVVKRKPRRPEKTQAERVKDALQVAGWSNLGRLRKTTGIDTASLGPILTRAVREGELSVRGTRGSYEYALPAAVAAE
jgi:hypothetical protein